MVAPSFDRARSTTRERRTRLARRWIRGFQSLRRTRRPTTRGPERSAPIARFDRQHRRAATTKVSVPAGARAASARRAAREMDGSTRPSAPQGRRSRICLPGGLARMRRDETDDDGEGRRAARARGTDSTRARGRGCASTVVQGVGGGGRGDGGGGLRASRVGYGVVRPLGRGTLSSFRAAWFFALASRAGTPLDADTTAAIRSAARGLATPRARRRNPREDPTLPEVVVVRVGNISARGRRT